MKFTNGGTIHRLLNEIERLRSLLSKAETALNNLTSIPGTGGNWIDGAKQVLSEIRGVSGG
mgnify:CR=1 FL=1